MFRGLTFLGHTVSLCLACRYSARVSEKDRRHFTARRYASAVGLFNNNMLCLSVRLAVSLSQVGVLSKRMDGSSFSDMEVSFDLP